MVVNTEVDLVLFIPGSEHDQETGHLGWLTLRIGGLLLLDGVVLRRSRLDRLSLTYPKRKGKSGRRYPVVRPVDKEVRQGIERQVFAALRAKGVRL